MSEAFISQAWCFNPRAGHVPGPSTDCGIALFVHYREILHESQNRHVGIIVGQSRYRVLNCVKSVGRMPWEFGSTSISSHL